MADENENEIEMNSLPDRRVTHSFVLHDNIWRRNAVAWISEWREEYTLHASWRLYLLLRVVFKSMSRISEARGSKMQIRAISQ